MVLLLSAGLAGAQEPLTAVARNLQFSNLTDENGLIGEFVQDVAQDGSGYMWFATQAGLNRYNGHDVSFYEHVSNDPDSLGNSFIWSLHVDSAGTLWVAHDRGVNRYDQQTDTFVRSPWAGVELPVLRVRKIMQDGEGVFWLGTLGEGLYSINPATGLVTTYQHDAADDRSLPSNNVIDVLEDRRGRLWVGTDGGGLARLDRMTGTFTAFQHDAGDDTSLGGNEVRSLHEDSGGRLWVGTASGGLNLMTGEGGRFQRFEHDPENRLSLAAGQVSAITEDDRGTLWVGTENGLSELRDNGQFAHYRNEVGNRASLVGNRVNAIFQDVSGVLWLATTTGVSRWNYFSDTFSYYNKNQGYLESDLVLAVDEDSKGSLWVGTYGGGLSHIHLTRDEVHHYLNDPDDPRSLSDNRVMSVHVDASDTTWVGTRAGGLLRLASGADSFDVFMHDPDDPTSIGGNAITYIFSDASGALWVGIFGSGVNRLDVATGRFERFRHDPENPRSISSDRVLSIYQDSEGYLWMGTESAGLNRFAPDSGDFERFNIQTNTTLVAQHGGTPWDILETRDGNLWFSTMSQGLVQWSAADRNRGQRVFTVYDAAAGLSSEIYGVLGGTSSELWLSSARGLFRFEPATGAVRKFDRLNGLRSNEFNHGATLRSSSGRIYFGGSAGLVGFYPSELPRNTRPPLVDLTASSRDDVLARTGTNRAMPEITLGYLDPFVAFDFVALDFVSPDKNLYRYRMNGLDSDWTEAEDYRRAVYTALPSGNYQFEVQASNNDGTWNRIGASVAVIVVPAPWNTWWAYVAYIAIIAGIAAWLLNIQRRKRMAEEENRVRLESLVTERTAELAERNQDLMTLNERLEKASVTDALTGLNNRRFVDAFMESELSKMRRSRFEADPHAEHEAEDKLLFLMMMDLDGFKAINDEYGHLAGDHALIEVKDRLLACCRTSDAIVRWGGDEFLVIGQATIHGAAVLAEKIRASIGAASYDLGNDNLGRLSASIGVAFIPFVDDDVDFSSWELICDLADTAAYQAKRNGRDGWVRVIGTHGLSHDDILMANEHMSMLAESGKIDIESSFGDALVLRNSSESDQPVRRD